VKRDRKTSPKQEEAWGPRLDHFLSSPLALRASHGLSDRAGIALHVGGESFFFQREKGEKTLKRVEAVKPDLQFWVPDGSMRHLLSLADLPDTGIGSMGVAIFECMFTSAEERKIKFQLHTGVLDLWAKGYFSILKAGGPEVASYLARFGFDSLSRVKEALHKLRG
jgi:hypothetical protein